MLFVIEYFSFYRGLVTSTDVLLVQLEHLSYAQVYYTQKFVIKKFVGHNSCYMDKFVMHNSLLYA